MFKHITNFFNNINLKKEDRFYLAILLILGIFLLIHLIKFNQLRGAFNSDIYIYLMNALNYADMNFNNVSNVSWMFSSPVICYLTSLLFRMNFVDVTAIYLVTGLFCIFGIFGMYCLLKTRFSPSLSFIGTLLFHSLSITLCWFANGMLDLPAVALILWNLVLIIAAVDKNPKYYLLFSLSFVISFFIRFTNTYILLIALLYFIKQHDIINLLDNLISDRPLFKQQLSSFFKSDEFKWICISLFVGVILLLFVFHIILSYGSKLAFIDIASSSTIGFKNSVADKNFIPDKWFYFKNFLSILSTNKIILNDQFGKPAFFSFLIIAILISGILLKIINYIKNFKVIRELYENKQFYKTKNLNKILIISLIILPIISRFAFKLNYLIAIFCIFLFFCILLSIYGKFQKDNNFAVLILNFSLFLFYMLIFSYMNIKCIRYILPAIPGFIYIVMISFESILKFIDDGFDDEKSFKYNINKPSVFKPKKTLTKIIPIILILICIFSICNYTNTMEIDSKGNDIVDVCDFLKDYDSNYQNKNVGSYMNRYYEWYLNMKLPIIHKSDEKLDYDYIIYQDKLKNKNYHEIYHSGSIYLYERN